MTPATCSTPLKNRTEAVLELQSWPGRPIPVQPLANRLLTPVALAYYRRPRKPLRPMTPATARRQRERLGVAEHPRSRRKAQNSDRWRSAHAEGCRERTAALEPCPNRRLPRSGTEPACACRRWLAPLPGRSSPLPKQKALTYWGPARG